MAGNVYVADQQNNLIRKITTPAGVVTTLAGAGPPAPLGNVNGKGTDARFNLPSGVAVDDTSGNVYVADTDNSEIREITPGGVVTTLAGSPTTGNANGTLSVASFYLPNGVAVDTAGHVYVADQWNNEIRKITP